MLNGLPLTNNQITYLPSSAEILQHDAETCRILRCKPRGSSDTIRTRLL